MSDVILPTAGTVFADPTLVAAPPVNTDPARVDATAPVQVGGSGQTWATVAAGAGQTAQVVLSGEGNRLNLGTGAAQVNAIGAGAIIESVQLVNSANQVIPDSGKTINLNAEGFNPALAAPVNTTATVSGDTPGTTVSIAAAAGNLTPSTGFLFYAHGGSGNDFIEGSGYSDFIRGGAGNDTINAGGGNDLVRGGAGSDRITLGAGNDTLFYTIDQIGAGFVDTVTDFASGDSVRVAQGQGITFSLSTDGTTITFTAGGISSLLTRSSGVFQLTDINFVA